MMLDSPHVLSLLPEPPRGLAHTSYAYVWMFRHVNTSATVADKDMVNLSLSVFDFLSFLVCRGPWLLVSQGDRP